MKKKNITVFYSDEYMTSNIFRKKFQKKEKIAESEIGQGSEPWGVFRNFDPEDEFIFVQEK